MLGIWSGSDRCAIFDWTSKSEEAVLVRIFLLGDSRKKVFPWSELNRKKEEIESSNESFSFSSEANNKIYFFVPIAYLLNTLAMYSISMHDYVLYFSTSKHPWRGRVMNFSRPLRHTHRSICAASISTGTALLSAVYYKSMPTL